MAISALATPTPKTFFPIYNHPLSSKPTSPFSAFCCSSNFLPDKEANKRNLSSVSTAKKCVFDVGVGFLAASILALSPLDADATRIEYYATVGDPLCEYNYARSGLGFCDLSVGTGVEAPYAELINIHYTARFADGTVFDSSYKRGRPLTLRVGVGKVIRGLDQGIFGGEGVPPMHVGGKRKLQIPPLLAYGPEPAGCFQVLLLVENGRAERFDVFLPLVHNSMDTNNHEIVFAGDCNIPANATLLYDINFVEIYSGNRSK